MSVLGLFSGSKSEPEPDPCDLTIHDAFDQLKNERRWLVVELVGELGPMHLSALADAIACITDTKRKTVYAPLYQSHLPKLDEAGIINLCDRGHEVTPGEFFDDCVEFQHVAEEHFSKGEWGQNPIEDGIDYIRTQDGEVAQ